MAIDLRTFASGDTDYISKLNANVATLEAAINALQAQAGAAGAGSALSAGFFLDSVFNHADAIIGVSSYKVTQGSTTVTVAPGGMYLSAVQTVVQSFNPVTLTFTGAVAGTYYITVDGVGTPMRLDAPADGTVYSVQWNGTNFSGGPIQIAPIFYDTAEAQASRNSAALPQHAFATLDHRLELTEQYAMEANRDANQALSISYDIQAALGSVSFRKIGITVDGLPGVKGAIQIDFDGVIVGWSCIADTVGSLTVDVSVKSSAGPPPNAPLIPDPVADKITASEPIVLSSQQSASKNEYGVDTWNTELQQWDVVQFRVVSSNLVTRATLYLRVMELFPSPPDVPSPLEE